jgi:hypothetical protein
LRIYEFHANRCREGRDFLADINETTIQLVPWKRTVFRKVKNGCLKSVLRRTVWLSESCSVFHRTRNPILDMLTVVFRPDDYCCTVINTSCCFLSTHLMFDWPPDKRPYITHATKTSDKQRQSAITKQTLTLHARVTTLDKYTFRPGTHSCVFTYESSHCPGTHVGVVSDSFIHDIRCRTEGRDVFLHCVGSQLDVCHSTECLFYRVPEHDSCHRDRGQGHD